MSEIRILRRKCEECTAKKPASEVTEMHDPFQAVVSPDEEPWMRWLCDPCAQARHDES